MLTLAKFLAVNYCQALGIINDVNQTLLKVLEEFGVMILSFPYVACPLTRFHSFAPFLQNTISLNTASYLYAVHGSFIPFPLSFYGRPSPYMRYLNAASFQLSHSPFFPLYPPGL